MPPDRMPDADNRAGVAWDERNINKRLVDVCEVGLSACGLWEGDRWTA